MHRQSASQSANALDKLTVALGNKMSVVDIRLRSLYFRTADGERHKLNYIVSTGGAPATVLDQD